MNNTTESHKTIFKEKNEHKKSKIEGKSSI